MGTLAVWGAFTAPVLAQTQVTNTANVTLPAGIVDTNTANNTSSVTVGVLALPRLTLVKQVVNDNGGTALATAWTLTATGPSTTISGATGTAAVTSVAVPAGSYALTETGGPAGYTAATWSCVKNGGAAVAANTVSLAGGDVATCTITNNDQAATLTLVKTVVNDNGGTATVSDFPLTATGPTTITGVSGTAAVTNASVSAGVYTLSEATVAGYAAGTWSCTAGTLSGNQLTLANGQSASCSITNNDQAATLTLVKTVINDDGGTATISNFPLRATGPTTITGVSGTAAVTNASVNAGVYILSEVTAAGYVAGTWNCTAGTLSGNQLTLSNGQSASCSITNDDEPAILNLEKLVDNTGGGTAQGTEWTLSASGPTPISGAGIASGEVAAGTYTLSESVGPAGYLAGQWECAVDGIPLVLAGGNQVTIQNGWPVRCSIVNTFQPAPSLTIDKTASPTTVSSAGQVVTYSFLVTNTGNVAITGVVINETAFSGTGTAPAITCPVTTLAPLASTTCSGTYALTQQDIDAGSVTNTATASGTDPVGGTTTSPPDSATVTSTATPNVSVVKTGPASVDVDSAFQYTLTLTNNGSSTTGTNLIVQDQLPAEMQATAASGATCTNLNVLGALLTCTVPGPLAPGGNAVVTLTVTAPSSTGFAPTTETYTNYAATNPTGTGNPGTPPGPGCVNGPTTSCSSVDTDVLSPLLNLVKTASDAEFTLGVPASYTIQVFNTGATATTAVSTVTDVVPNGLTIGVLPAGCTATGQTVTCTIPAGLAVGVGAAVNLVIPVTPTEAAVPSVTNTASVSGGGDPGCPGQARCENGVTTPVTFNSALTLDKTASPTTVSAAGQVVTYSFLVTNTGNVAITDLQINETAFNGTGTVPVVSCPVSTLAAGANTTCTGTYTVTQQDIDAGSITNTATASGTDPIGNTTTSPPDSATVTSTLAPAQTLVKALTANADGDASGSVTFDDELTYTVTVTNTGNTTLTDVVISDPLIAPSTITCASVAPGTTCVLTGVYTVTLTDVANGSISNTAVVTSPICPVGSTDVACTDTEVTPVQAPVVEYAKSASTTGPVAVGETITYTLTTVVANSQTTSVTTLTDTLGTG
ncbi:hypothetical protein, partial [Pseudoxanthomonas sp.]|uniref:DUF7507 domain-containing protein n=1 Tax=Pseudoxanthomonas sp. TaxID=1871049 RepID=UPI0025E18B5C